MADQGEFRTMTPSRDKTLSSYANRTEYPSHPTTRPPNVMDDSAYSNSSGLHTSNSVMRHANRSVPNLPLQHSPQHLNGAENMPPIPSFDPASTLEAFSSMRLNDPLPRGTSAMSMASEHIAHSSTINDPNRTARMTNGLPSAPNHALPSRAVPERSDPRYSRQNSLRGEPSVYQESASSTDYESAYAEDTFSSAIPNAPLDAMSSNAAYVHSGGDYRQPAWLGQQPFFAPGAPRSGLPPSGEYDTLYAAASSVLGMGPPPGPSSGPQSGYSASHGSLAESHYPIGSSQSVPQMGYQQPPSSGVSQYSGASSILDEDAQVVPRPSLQRSGTTASVVLRTQKTKAVDLSAPPYTKAYIDQYRQRLKGDPDPEAHFLYAKYLIEAAKRIGADAKDQRAVKKYRDFLITESLKVIRRLATQGQPYDEAQFFLANCHGTGMLGLPVDHERAYHLYLQAAKQNHPAASYRVAVCNEIGAGTRREPPRAAAFYRKAASLGDTPAMYKLGMILLQGLLGEAKNPREAINWLKRAAEQADEENPHALHELGLLHEQPNSTLVVHDPGYAKNLYTQAAHLGYTPSQYKLGQCYEYGSLTCALDPRRSIAWYTKAAEKGYPEAELALSGWYLTGSEGVLKQSDSEAYLWARRAANKGLSKAEYAVGYYAEVGIGIKQDIEFAKRWYMRAAAQGNKRAMNRLTELKRMGNKRTANVARPTRQQAKDECVVT